MANKRYQLGDTFSLNFDYEGMLDYALEITVNTSVNDLEKLLDSFEDVNYHREAAPLYDMIEMIKFQNEYGKSEHTIDCTKKALLAFKKECEETLINIVNSQVRMNTVENNAPNHLDDYNEMIESFNKEQEENEKLTINDIKELVKSIPNDAKLGEYIRKRI